jgi:hypothetical protein
MSEDDTDYPSVAKRFGSEIPEKIGASQVVVNGKKRPFFEACMYCLTIWNDEDAFNGHKHNGMILSTSQEMRDQFLKEVVEKRKEYYAALEKETKSKPSGGEE